MIAIHYRGKKCWFEFPHTLENQGMLLRRLEREARQQHIKELNEHVNYSFRVFAHHLNECAKRTKEAFEEFGRQAKNMDEQLAKR